MRFKAIVDYVQAMFYNPVVGTNVGKDAAADALFLSYLCTQVKTMTATNGRFYWYLFLPDSQYLDLARFVFLRNGLKPQFHWSRYGCYSYDRLPSLRIEQKYLNNNPNLAEFVKSISARAGEHSEEFKARAEFLRNQMKTASK